MELNNVKIYRITHIENIPHILEHGITHKNSPNKNPNYNNIGDISLIDTRNRKVVRVDNGEYNLIDGVTTITLGDFIPFYFGIRMPMLYVSQHGGNFVEKPTPSEDLIYLVCPLSKVILNERKIYFTDGHATDILTTFYDNTKLNDLINLIDWTAIKSSYWGGSENLNLKRKKQAEFLVSGDLSPDYVFGFGCYNENTKNKLIAMGITENKIKAIPQAYY